MIEVIEAGTVDAAAEQIINELKEDTKTTGSIIRNNVIYFDGWDGLGASAVLRAVAQRLRVKRRRPARLKFDQIIHIDCSKWKSRRAFQRMIAEKLKLPAEVTKVFCRQDEEDDYRGVDQASRAEVPEVVREMYELIKKLNHRFLVIFHNGSCEEVDLATFCGFPLSGDSTSKVLWTFQGRFRLYPRGKVDLALNKSTAGATDVLISAATGNDAQHPKLVWSYFVRQEAADLVVASGKNNTSHGLVGPGGLIDQPAHVAACFLYLLNLSGMSRHFTVDYDLATHGCNYWICDGIIQAQHGEVDVKTDDWSWRAAYALQHEMKLDADYYDQHLPSHLVKCAELTPCWTSPTYRVIQVLDEAIPNWDIFQHYNKLSVLKLSSCTFNFSSPPFQCCRNLRFLWLDHCQDHEIGTYVVGKEEEDLNQCFERLWVMDVRYTPCNRILSAQMMDLMTHLRELNVTAAQDDMDMGQLQGRLPNIHKLCVTKSTVCRSSSGSTQHDFLEGNTCGTVKSLSVSSSSSTEHDLYQGRDKTELHDLLANNSAIQSLIIANNSAIQSLISSRSSYELFSGRDRMEHLDLTGNTGSMESLYINSNCSALETLIICENVGLKLICLKGCAKLKDIVLRGWFEYLLLSQLPKPRYLWKWSTTLPSKSHAFRDLKLLHLHFCPRLMHVSPLSHDDGGLSNLETLEIFWCGDLKEIFSLDIDARSIEFPSLKRIHLHEVPRLHSICGLGRTIISAPKLESVKIRGCWRLRRLPAISDRVKCDCEKDWWDRLEWEGVEANHHPALYKPTHSRYYKKTLLRGSVLR